MGQPGRRHAPPLFANPPPQTEVALRQGIVPPPGLLIYFTLTARHSPITDHCSPLAAATHHSPLVCLMYHQYPTIPPLRSANSDGSQHPRRGGASHACQRPWHRRYSTEKDYQPAHPRTAAPLTPPALTSASAPAPVPDPPACPSSDPTESPSPLNSNGDMIVDMIVACKPSREPDAKIAGKIVEKDDPTPYMRCARVVDRVEWINIHCVCSMGDVDALSALFARARITLKDVTLFTFNTVCENNHTAVLSLLLKKLAPARPVLLAAALTALVRGNTSILGVLHLTAKFHQNELTRPPTVRDIVNDGVTDSAAWLMDNVATDKKEFAKQLICTAAWSMTGAKIFAWVYASQTAEWTPEVVEKALATASRVGAEGVVVWILQVIAPPARVVAGCRAIAQENGNPATAAILEKALPTPTSPNSTTASRPRSLSVTAQPFVPKTSQTPLPPSPGVRPSPLMVSSGPSPSSRLSLSPLSSPPSVTAFVQFATPSMSADAVMYTSPLGGVGRVPITVVCRAPSWGCSAMPPPAVT